MAHVDTTSTLYNEMALKWPLIDVLLGGTQAIRDAREEWLPIEPKEKIDKYNLRIGRSFLFGAYKNTIRRLTSKPFSKPLTFDPEPTGKMEGFDADVDRQGTSATQFAKEFFEHCLNYGLSHILVDFPTMVDAETAKDELGVQPLWTHVKAPQLISWKSVQGSSGGPILTEIRIKGSEIRETGDYEDARVDVIRVIRRKDWETWVSTGGEYVKESEGLNSIGEIPLITVYLDKTGFLTGAPPMEDLAWLNIRHWQSSSDQTNILRFARCGILHAKGFRKEESDLIVVGPNALVKSQDENSSLTVVEHKGNAIEAGERDIKLLEQRMEILGMQPEIARSSMSTATSKMLDENRVETEIQAWIRAVETGLESAWEMAEKWLGIEPSETAIDIFSDFALSMKSAQDIEALSKARIAGDISRETFLREMRRRGILEDSLVIEDEMNRLDEEMAGITEDAEDDDRSQISIVADDEREVG